MEQIIYRDRTESGQRLADKLLKYKDQNPIVLALPRGGVILGDIIAKRLNCPLSLIITRKIGHPINPEYAIGAIGISGQKIINEAEVRMIEGSWLEKEEKREQEEARRREREYLKGKKPKIEYKTAILVDDGIATGLTMRVAIKEARLKNPAKIVVAVPVAPKEVFDEIRNDVDEFVALSIPEDYLGSVGAYYQEFPQVSDKEVVDILEH